MATIIEAYEAAKEGKVVRNRYGKYAVVRGENERFIWEEDNKEVYMQCNNIDEWTIEEPEQEQENDWEDFIIDLHEGIYYEFMYLGAWHALYLAERYGDFIGYVYEINDEKRVYNRPLMFHYKGLLGGEWIDGAEVIRPVAVRFKK